MKKFTVLALGASMILWAGCSQSNKQKVEASIESVSRIPIIFDTDANNELDDQHALAYLLFNEGRFEVLGVTTNATRNGGEIEEHDAEAKRVMTLCRVADRISLFTGANADFEGIRGALDQSSYDGHAAVDFIIEESLKPRDQKLVLLPVGKLTNIALALEKAPEIIPNIRIVWLGSNYPDPGEYNLVNDTLALKYILQQPIPIEMVTCRYGSPSGSDAVRVTPQQIDETMPGLGGRSEAIEGRHGGTFSSFGDYSVSLFQHAEMHGDPPSRALFDMVAVAILKNPDWGRATTISKPTLQGKAWVPNPDGEGTVVIWGDFDREAILDDFFEVLADPEQLP